MYTEECIQTFLENQEQLFDEPVAENYEEAEAWQWWQIPSARCVNTCPVWARMWMV